MKIQFIGMNFFPQKVNKGWWWQFIVIPTITIMASPNKDMGDAITLDWMFWSVGVTITK